MRIKTGRFDQPFGRYSLNKDISKHKRILTCCLALFIENRCGPDILRDIGISIPLSSAFPHCAPFGQNIGSNFSATSTVCL